MVGHIDNGGFKNVQLTLNEFKRYNRGQGAFTYDVRLLGRQVGQEAPSDFT